LKLLVRHIGVFVSSLFLLSCSDDAAHVLPRHSGAPGEIVCIANSDLWDGEVGDIVYKHFSVDQPLLPQAEPFFNVFQFDPALANNITRQHRNLVFINIGNAAGKTRIEAIKDKWAQDQLVVNIYASTISEFDSLMADHGYPLVQKFNEYERKRLQQKNNLKRHQQISDTLFSIQKVKISVPSDCDIALNKKDFMWIQRQRERNVSGTMHDILEGVFIYQYPYINDSAFTNTSIIAVRDSLLKKYVPGPEPGSYMTTEYLLPTQSEVVDFNGKYAVFTRGLWRTNGAIMGGPFVNLTIYDSEKQRVVTAEGFVFAPKFDKREYLREVEAMIFSVDF